MFEYDANLGLQGSQKSVRKVSNKTAGHPFTNSQLDCKLQDIFPVFQLRKYQLLGLRNKSCNLYCYFTNYKRLRKKKFI